MSLIPAGGQAQPGAMTMLGDQIALIKDDSPASKSKAATLEKLFPGFVDIPTTPSRTTVVTIEYLDDLQKKKGEVVNQPPAPTLPPPASSTGTPSAPATGGSAAGTGGAVTDKTTGNPDLDGLVTEIVKTNNDIDSLLADYQKAVNGELKDAQGNKIDPFVIQTKLQQAMQRRLELITLLSNIQKMSHDAIMAILSNLR